MINKYLFHESTGVQHIERCVSGLAADMTEFVVCRPHFDFSTLATREEIIEWEDMIKKWIHNCIPNNVIDHLHGLIIRCFATIILSLQRSKQFPLEMHPLKYACL